MSQSAHRARSKRKAQINRKQPKKILIAENDPSQATVAKSILEQKGYHCTLAANGSQAVTLARIFIPDLFISSIRLKEIDGLKAAELIRNDPKTSSIPILIVSAKSPHLVGQRTPAPFNYYLPKPFTSEQLISTVELLIR